MQGISYSVDLVLCIDQTGSMGHIIEKVKEHALTFGADVRRTLEEKDKSINALRVKVIGFRDYYFDGDESMEESEFFSLPEDDSAYNSFVKGLRADGGGDEPESGLEALAIAMQSKWAKDTKHRQVIVVWTDASAHPLEKAASARPSNYPSTMPQSFDDLTDMWEGQSYMSGSNKRLIMFTPDAAGWTDIAANWEQTVHFPSKAGAGLQDHEYSEILDSIANSV
ncbi:vWA domain-containing protein [Arthrobacter sp. HMWF013]|uniref:vWA domain-containing protein n=1 Tax=Arthrobacter sp. HMWF013 TaxID=2056849 RepID=UPI000D37C4FA|nr:vWA domain-containing protein [Arthrobacter sp. HMWF013]PTT69216.1 VWA domain-containing protein [Arthrobacter sp. HMWF013]